MFLITPVRTQSPNSDGRLGFDAHKSIFPEKTRWFSAAELAPFQKGGNCCASSLKKLFSVPCKWTVIALFLGWRGGEKTFPPLLFPQISFLPPSFLRPPKRCLFRRRPFFPFPGFLSRFKLAWKKKKRKLLHRLFSPAFLWGIYVGEWEEFEAKKKQVGKGRRKKEETTISSFWPFLRPRVFTPEIPRKTLFSRLFEHSAHTSRFFLWHTPDPKMITGCGGGFFWWLSAGAFCVPISPPKFLFTGKQSSGALVSPNCSMGLCSWGHNYDDYMSSPRRRGSKGTGSLARNYAL